MVRLHALSWMLIVSLATLCAAAVETFTSDEGRFTIRLPEKPKATEQILPIPGAGNVTMHIFTASFPQQTGGIVMTYTDYPPQAVAAKNPDEMLDDSINGSIRGMKATLVKSGRITQGGAPGREFSWTAPGPKGPLEGQARIFLVGPRLYQVLVIATAEKSLQPDAYDMTFKSFEFKPAPTAPARAAMTKPPTTGTMTKAPAPAKGAGSGKAAAKFRGR